MFFEILKGLYLLLSNFFEGQFKWIFLFSSHMLSPTFSPWEFCLFLLNCFFIAFVTCFQLFCIPMSGVVHTGVEVHRMDSEMSRLVEWPWLQLMCCTVCLPCGCNFRWWKEVREGSECWLVCRCWTPEIEFNKRLSSSIIRLVNYSVTTSLIYKLII